MFYSAKVLGVIFSNSPFYILRCFWFYNYITLHVGKSALVCHVEHPARNLPLQGRFIFEDLLVFLPDTHVLVPAKVTVHGLKLHPGSTLPVFVVHGKHLTVFSTLCHLGANCPCEMHLDWSRLLPQTGGQAGAVHLRDERSECLACGLHDVGTSTLHDKSVSIFFLYGRKLILPQKYHSTLYHLAFFVFMYHLKSPLLFSSILPLLSATQK